MHTKAQTVYKIFANANLAALANHKSNQTASFYARKPESFTASIYARNALRLLKQLEWKITTLRDVYIAS